MKPKIRTLLITLFAFIFLIGGAYLIILAQGWVVDINHLKIVKTGSLSLKFNPKDAALTISGRSQSSKTGFINNGILIKNLLPGRYDVNISKESFEEWNKNFLIESGKVEAASQIRLWPKIFKTEPITINKVSDFSLTNKGVVYKDDNDTLRFGEYLLRGREIILSSKYSNFIITLDKQQNYFLTDLSQPFSALNLSELFNSLKQRQLNFPGFIPIKNVLFHPFSREKIIIITQSSIYLLDLQKIQLERIFTNPELNIVLAANNEVVAFAKNGEITLINLIIQNKEVIPLPSQPEIKPAKIYFNNDSIFFLTEDSRLMILDRKNKNLIEISKPRGKDLKPPFITAEKPRGIQEGEGIKDFYLAPDNKRMALIFKDNSLSIFYLDNYETDIKYSRGTALEISPPNKDEIKNFNWLGKLPNYFLAFLNDDLLISEIDKRSPLNYKIITDDVKDYLSDGTLLYILKHDNELIKINLGV